MSADRDDYLWDKSGEPDPRVQALEERLGGLRHAEAAPDWAREVAGAGPAPAAWPSRWRRRADRAQSARYGRRGLVALAAVAAALLAVAVFRLGPMEWWGSSGADAWRVDAVAGRPLLDSRRLGGGLAGAFSSPARLRAGGALETGAGDRARLRLAGVGEVELAPRSRLRLLSAGPQGQLLALDAGVLSAAIRARPQRFAVETPQGRAVDLGCYFTLEVLPDGRERLRVEAGWVALLVGDREAFVPGGAAVVSAPGRLGVPVLLQARPLAAALDRWTALPTGEERRAALDAALGLARGEDAFTLWHLLATIGVEERQRVYARLAALAPPPPGVTAEGIVAGDVAMRDRWWESLGLGTASWWRGWRVAYPASRFR